MIKDMNSSLIFRGRLNYPFPLIFSSAGCARYGSFNVSSVCVLITRRNRIYNTCMHALSEAKTRAFF